MTTGERVKILRKELHLTLEKFGEKIGLKKSALSRIENDSNNLTDQTTLAICREFNVNEEWLRTGSGDMFVAQTRDEQIASFVDQIQLDADNSFKKRFISMLSSLGEAEWEVLERMAEKLYNDKTERQTAATKDLSSMTVEELEEEYKKSVLGVASKTISSASSTTSGTEKIAVNN